MIRWYVGLAISLSLLGSLVARSEELVLSEQQIHAAIFDNVFRLKGVFLYEEGDFIAYKCGDDICGDLLIRDEALQKLVGQLHGKMIEIEVQRVLACPKSGELTIACVRSVNGSALKIRKWIQPSGLGADTR